MTYTKIIDQDLMKELRVAHKVGLVSTEEIKFYVKSEMQRVYNGLLLRLECCRMTYNRGDVFEREFIENFVKDNDFVIFKYLIQKGYIGVCGSGYMMERSKIELSQAEQQAVKKIMRWQEQGDSFYEAYSTDRFVDGDRANVL